MTVKMKACKALPPAHHPFWAIPDSIKALEKCTDKEVYTFHWTTGFQGRSFKMTGISPLNNSPAGSYEIHVSSVGMPPPARKGVALHELGHIENDDFQNGNDAYREESEQEIIEKEVRADLFAYDIDPEAACLSLKYGIADNKKGWWSFFFRPLLRDSIDRDFKSRLRVLEMMDHLEVCKLNSK